MVFDKEWFARHQKGLLWMLNAPIIKVWFRWVMSIKEDDCPIDYFINRIEPDSFSFNGKILKNGLVELSSDFRTHDKFAKRLYYAFRPIWYVFHIWDSVSSAIPRLNLGFDTLTSYPDAGSGATTCDGAVRRTATETFSNIRTGAGTSAFPSTASIACARLLADVVSNQYTSLYRAIFTFNTSALGAGATISGAVFSVYGNTLANDLGSFEVDIVSSTPASNNNVVTGDYANFGTTPFSSVAYASLTAAGYNDFTLDANGIANVNKSGISAFGTRLNWDTDNNFTGSWVSSGNSKLDIYYADQAGTSNDPKLVITYSAAAPATAGFLYLMV